MTTTHLIVVCPSCAEEVVLPLHRVEVEVGDTIMVSHAGEMPLALNANATASGRHNCPRG